MKLLARLFNGCNYMNTKKIRNLAWKIPESMLSRNNKQNISRPSLGSEYSRGSKFGNDDGRYYLAGIAAALALAGACSSIVLLESTPNKKEIDRPYNVQDIVSQLKYVLREDQVEIDSQELTARSKSLNSYHKSTRIPDILVFPESTADVSNVMKICFQNNVPVIAFGGGTSIEGQTITSNGGLVIDLTRMNKIVSLHEEDLDMTVEAGLGYVELNEILKEKNLWFPLDPGPGASIGGMCACRCSGSTALRYGSMRENVLSLTAVLADGTIIKTGNRARKSSAGYDLTRLLIGSEGTLAIITEVTLKLHGIPAVSHALRLSFPGRRGIYQAASTAKATLNCGVTIGRCELMDDKMIEVVNRINGCDLPVATTLLYELTGISDETVIEATKVVQRIAIEHGATNMSIATSAEEKKEMWRIRKEALWSIIAAHPDREALITDVCVPLSELPGLIQETKDSIDKIQTIPAPIVAHAGDGNFHVLVMLKVDDPEEVAKVKKLSTTMAERAITVGGTCTGEHGVGVGKKDLLALELGEGALNLSKTIKCAIDPSLILNPGKIFDIEEHFVDSKEDVVGKVRHRNFCS